jgi:hypothetical protein
MVVQSCIRLTNFVDVDLWQNIDVECRLEAEKNVDLHFARTPPHHPPPPRSACFIFTYLRAIH